MWVQSPPRLRVHVAEEGGLAIGCFGPVHMVIYRRTPTVADLHLSDRHHRALREAFPGGTALLTYIFHRLEMPPAEVRQLGAQMLREVAPLIRCSATVVEGDGFMASTARAVLSGIQLLSRTPCPSKLFSTVDDAATWIATYDESLSVEGLVEAAARLRAS